MFTGLPHSGRSEFAQRPFVVGLGTCARMRGGAFLAHSVRGGGGSGRIKLDRQSLFGYSKDLPRVSPVRRCGFVAAVPEMAEPLGFCFQRVKQFNAMPAVDAMFSY